MKTERNIWIDVISFIKSTHGIEGYEVLQSAQAQLIKQSPKALILDMIGAPNLSWQGNKDVSNGGELMEHQEIFYQEYNFQLSCSKKKSVNDRDFSAFDILLLVATFLQSEAGIDMITKAGYGIERIRDIRNSYFINESDVYERLPSFDFSLVRKQIIRSEIPSLKGFKTNLINWEGVNVK